MNRAKLLLATPRYLGTKQHRPANKKPLISARIENFLRHLTLSNLEHRLLYARTFSVALAVERDFLIQIFYVAFPKKLA